MPNLSSFEQKLSYTSSKIAHMSDEFAKHHDKLSSAELKTMTAELKRSQKSLLSSFKTEASLEFDSKLVSSILSYINKIKKSTSSTTASTIRKTQKMNFLEALADFQALLKTLKRKKVRQSHKQVRPVVKIQGVQTRSLSQIKEIDRHLLLTESKLRDFKKGFESGTNFLTREFFNDITDILKKANIYLTKTKGMQSSISGKAMPEYDSGIMKKLLKYVHFFQNTIADQIRAGEAVTQANLFWYTLREFQTLVQELENLKKTRGKVVAKTITDLLT